MRDLKMKSAVCVPGDSRSFVRWFGVVCLVACALAVAPGRSLAAAEQIDDPAYVHWAKFKPGSVAKTTTESNLGGQKMTIQMTTTLIEVVPEKITVEIKTEVEAGGTKLPSTTKKTAIAAKRAKPAKEPQSVKEGTEDVTVGGKTYACHYSEEMHDTQRIKSWMSDEIPGGVVKFELSDGESTMKTNLVEYSVKK
jgi:hypothetical protein